MSLIWEMITGSLWPYLAAAGAALIGIVGVYFKGRSDAKAKAKAAQADAHIKTTERVLHETVSDDPVSDIRQRMRDRAGKP